MLKLNQNCISSIVLWISVVVVTGCTQEQPALYLGSSRTQATRSQADCLRLSTNERFVKDLDPLFVNAAAEGNYILDIRNDRDSTITIQKTEHSCGCTQSTLDDEVLPPGKETKLRVRLDLKGRRGAQAFQIKLISANGLKWECLFRTVVFHEFAFVPDQLNLGMLRRNEGIVRELYMDVVGLSNDSLPVVESVTSEDPGIKIVMGSNLPVQQTHFNAVAKRYPLRLELEPQTTVGERSTKVRATVLYKSRKQTYELVVQWRVRSMYQSTPMRAFFSIPSGQKQVVKKILQIKKINGGSLVIADVKTDHPSVTAIILRNNTDMPEVEISVVPDNIHEPMWGTIELRFLDEMEPTFKIPYAIIRGN